MTVDAPAKYVFQAKVGEAYPKAVASKGNYITVEDPATKETKVLLDAMTGAAVGALGHGDAEIVEEMKKAAANSTYTYGAYYSNYAAEELAKFIVDHSPSGAFAAALFTGSGSEANENAMKICYQYHLEKNEPQRVKFIGRKQAYHGYTIGSLSLGHGPRRTIFQEILCKDENFPKVSQCYPYRNMKEGETVAEYSARLVQELDDTFVANGPETVGGVIMETVGGSTFGTSPPVPGYLDGVKKVCEKYGALLIIDEVMCGMGRCGTLHAWEQFMDNSNGPDLQSIGKTLGSGFVTLAGLLISPKVKKVYDEGSGFIAGAQTYHCHDFNCKVGLAVQKKVARDNLVANVKETGTYMADGFKKALAESKIVGDIRGVGTFWSIEFVKDKATKEPFDPKLDVGHMIQDLCTKNGITSMGMQGTIDGKNGDHITVAPAFIFTKEDADIIIKAMVDAVTEAESILLA
ncbi:unnamed protein product [Kuraishia capsulata CBS 1993]|uniref:Aminotransferase class III n=1 Tax=Kuraishia capsulata CBS 1993 TaxID=1382522 RepID=W6MLM2_9ASCO|nr:uncharacterized protein KUCA_T00003392001 [Kuraishia capsulata CBS 1993]CDK27414.1 unnamed protein product [Kuraishia capsulata CBS 1993]